tara:strand:+ start:15751 stop:17409 length:1659 start_codon:yes stop_codon:yes gene_type:complete
MSDGVQLAADVYIPDSLEGEKLPVLVQFERYWRSSQTRKTKDESPKLYGISKLFSENGYVIVVVDTRGSGASYGTRLSEYQPQEVEDAGEVLDWIVAQSWSNGKVGAYGTSYTGTTAELLCATKHPAVKAVIPGWSDFDLYRSSVRPYGMLASSFIRKWGLYVRWLDRNRSFFLRSEVRPVGEKLPKQVKKDHRKNLKVYRTTKKAEFRDEDMGSYGYDECSVINWKDEIEESDVPMFIPVSWMDAGTAEGAIERLKNFSNDQKVLFMSTSHGGWSHASPFVVGDSTIYPTPRYEVQCKMQLEFFDHHLKGEDNGVDDWPMVRYYNMGEEKFHESDQWPVEGTEMANFYFQKDGGLSLEKPEEITGMDEYKVGFGVTTGERNRWTTQMGDPVLSLNQRQEMDARMLTYTTPPLEEDLQITGTPKITLELASTHEDGAVLVYLEVLDDQGNSIYVTEGGLRLIHHKITGDGYNDHLHSFRKRDEQPMLPGASSKIVLNLMPTSVLIKKGYRLRIAIAGADKDTFDKLPKRGKPTLSIFRNAELHSFVTLPVVK